ncbi:histone-like nucleoid-structuring protein Lsr2 [Pseudonocardia sp. GCM10023141]|uniref:histone-like nucleoid-structuring protein Lsr2 n=1 Tax=Pseudonocardia sp. GCM10023141 TaxID=3252653 RepID=UPI003620132D
MAQHINVVLVDDLDGSVASESVVFGLDGRGYEIDLSGDNAAKLREALAPFVASARRGSAGGAARAQRPAASTVNSAAVRQWARENGHDLAERGRIPAAVMTAYANRGTAGAPVAKVAVAPKAAPAEKADAPNAAPKAAAAKVTAPKAAPKSASAKAPASKSPATKTPATKTAAAKAPATKTAAAKAPAAKTAAAKKAAPSATASEKAEAAPVKAPRKRAPKVADPFTISS